MFGTPDVKRKIALSTMDGLNFQFQAIIFFMIRSLIIRIPRKLVPMSLVQLQQGWVQNFAIFRTEWEFYELWSDTFTVMELEAAWLEGSLSVEDYPTLKVLHQMKMVLLLDQTAYYNKTLC